MKVVSLNIGSSTEIKSRGKLVKTGIKKVGTQDPVFVSTNGMEGDAVLNTKHHGGPDQAVYAYRIEDYEWWSEELGRQIKPTSFGENLTLEGILSPALRIGVQLVFDEIVLEVTAPRIPCQTLNTVMGGDGFSKHFAKAARSGFYFRVIKEGYLSTGESFVLEHPDVSWPTTVELFYANYRKLDNEELQKFIAAPIDIRTRVKLQHQLERLA